MGLALLRGVKQGKPLVKAQLLDHGCHGEEWQSWAFVPGLEALAWPQPHGVMAQKGSQSCGLFATRGWCGQFGKPVCILGIPVLNFLVMAQVQRGGRGTIGLVWGLALLHWGWCFSCRLQAALGWLPAALSAAQVLMMQKTGTWDLKNNFILKQSVPLGMYSLLLGWAFAKCYLIES